VPAAVGVAGFEGLKGSEGCIPLADAAPPRH
jgi:hypothetical protein